MIFEQVIAIRADANSRIGFGHLTRMKALARELEDKGARVVFLSVAPERIEGFDVKSIHQQDDPNLQDSEIELLLGQTGATSLVVDSYDYDQARLDRLGQMKIPVIYIDDLNLHRFDVDMVVNGNLYAPKMDYQGRACFLLGNDFLLMRREFSGLPTRKVHRDVSDVMITMGGADITNQTPVLLEILIAYPLFDHLRWHVVIGPAFKNEAEIRYISRGKPNIHLYHNPDMRELMLGCDLCISAGGSTVYELAAAGVPALLVVTADNQIQLVNEADKRGLAAYAKALEVRGEEIYKSLDRLMDYQIRSQMAERGQSLFDGRGAQRVADSILSLSG